MCREQRERFWLAVCATLPVLSILVALRPRTGTDDHPPFDPAVWRAHSELQDAELIEQGDRLARSGRLVGNTRAEAIELLGEPSHVRRAGEFGDVADSLVYRLGPYGFAGVDSEWLSVVLGSDGRVSGCYRWRD